MLCQRGEVLKQNTGTPPSVPLSGARCNTLPSGTLPPALIGTHLLPALDRSRNSLLCTMRLCVTLSFVMRYSLSGDEYLFSLRRRASILSPVTSIDSLSGDEHLRQQVYKSSISLHSFLSAECQIRVFYLTIATCQPPHRTFQFIRPPFRSCLDFNKGENSA